MKRKSRTKQANTNNSNQDFQIPPPRRHTHMLQAINSRGNRQDLNNIEHHSSPYSEPDLCKGYISMEQDENDRFSISFPRNCVFQHVLSDTDPLNNVDS